MSLDRNEFMDILFMAKHMASSDGEMHPMEKKVLYALFKAIGVNHDELENIKSKTSIEQSINALVSHEAKQILIDVLVLVASADNKFEEEERQLIVKVMRKLGMDPQAHPYFSEGNALNVEKIRSNVKLIIGRVKKLV